MDQVVIICEMENLATWLMNNATDYRVRKVAGTIRHNIQMLAEINTITERINSRGKAL